MKILFFFPLFLYRPFSFAPKDMALYLTRRLTLFHQSLTRHSHVGQIEPTRFTYATPAPT